jgi:hypothetical protein
MLPPQGPDSPPAFRLLPTPDPDTFTFVTTHEQKTIREWPRTYSTVFKNWKHNVSSWKEAISSTGKPYGEFIYTDSGEAPAGYVSFVWAPQKTEEEKNVPFRTTKRFGNHHWPPILQQVKILEDHSFPQSTNGYNGGVILAPRYFDRVVYIPSVDEGSMFLEEEFLSPTPFEIGQYPVPVPSSVSYSYLGISGNFPECLHPRLVFPSKRMATAAYSTGDGATGAAGALSGQIFPETNFTEWAPFIVSHTQQSTNGVYYAKRVTVFPPGQPETIIR